MKKKVVMLSDHALSTSGVGTQSRHLIEGLISKGDWSFKQFGAALRHDNYQTIVVNNDFIIKPIDGFGSKELIRLALIQERPEVLLIFTDPRFFIWLFDIEDEVHQVCPIAWWHVWDNTPYPEFNNSFYEATDLINCHSHHTYMQLKDRFEDKVNFIPHAVPEKMYFKLSDEQKEQIKISIFGEDKKDVFTGIWMNRNAKRKRPSDVLRSWKLFLDKQETETGKRDSILIMHTDPLDQEGPNLFAVAEQLEIVSNVYFSKDRIEFEKINSLLNVSDVCINISFAEGFGLTTLEAMMTGTPIVAAKTGGLTRQVVDHRDGTENGVALDIEMTTMVGSQVVPYINEDYVSCESTAEGIFKIFSMTKEEKDELSSKVQSYAKECFALQKTIDDWDETMTDLSKNWKESYKRWELIEI